MTVVGPLLKGLPEQRLLRAAQKADHEAFRQLMEMHTPSLKRFIAGRVKATDREDVLQETWLAAWESLGTIDLGKRFRPWLFSVCFHKIQDYWRREHSRPSTSDISDAEHLTAYLPREFARVELRESMRKWWESCTDDQRELLRMKYGDGLTLQEISIILDRNLNTLKYHLYEIHAKAAGNLQNIPDLLQAIEENA